MTVNWFMVAVGVLQYGAAALAFHQGSWRMGVMNVCVATANLTISTVRG